ncbi:hypothetical protein C365_02821 [Cryptococcus neoformans Bt85]|nr:hypothetical protein C365_02821 [Cryptococcus neoformans var. grubii Bt85]
MLFATRITRPSTRIKVSMVTSLGRATFSSATNKLKIKRPIPTSQEVGRTSTDISRPPALAGKPNSFSAITGKGQSIRTESRAVAVLPPSSPPAPRKSFVRNASALSRDSSAPVSLSIPNSAVMFDSARCEQALTTLLNAYHRHAPSMDKFEVTLNIEAIRHTQASFIVYVKHGWRIIAAQVIEPLGGHGSETEQYYEYNVTRVTGGAFMSKARTECVMRQEKMPSAKDFSYAQQRHIRKNISGVVESFFQGAVLNFSFKGLPPPRVSKKNRKPIIKHGYHYPTLPIRRSAAKSNKGYIYRGVTQVYYLFHPLGN